MGDLGGIEMEIALGVLAEEEVELELELAAIGKAQAETPVSCQASFAAIRNWHSSPGEQVKRADSRPGISRRQRENEGKPNSNSPSELTSMSFEAGIRL